MTHFNNRPARFEDISGLEVIVDKTGLFPSEMTGDMLREAAAADHVWLTAVSQGAAVGLCYARPEDMTDGTWNMLALAVHPDVQRGGIARALVAAMEHELSTRDQRLLIVDTSGDAAFAGARAFYAAAGYEQVATIPDYWAAGDAKCTFAKRLS